MMWKRLFKGLIVLALMGHTVLTVQSFIDHGYAGYFPPFSDANTTQIFSDLVIALSLVNVWVFYDLRQRGLGLGWGVLGGGLRGRVCQTARASMGSQNLLERCRSLPTDATMWSSWKNAPRKTSTIRWRIVRGTTSIRRSARSQNVSL